jgi:hypothetical protein
MRILLAGTHRCGSTWVANVLGRTPGIRNVYEPDEPRTDILGTLSSDRAGEFPVLSAGDSFPGYATVWDVAFSGGWPWRPSPTKRRLGRVVRKLPPRARSAALSVLARATTAARSETTTEHVLVKSANCAFSLEWVAQRYQPQVVVQHRNPLSTVASWIAVNIDADLSLVDDPSYRQLWQEPLKLPDPPSSSSAVAKVAWTVGVQMVALKVTADRHPDWIVISHDALCRDPLPQFQSLCDRLGLTWNDQAAEYLAASDRPGFVDTRRNPRKASDDAAAAATTTSRRSGTADAFRRRLTEDQIEEARAVLSTLPLGDWGTADVRG